MAIELNPQQQVVVTQLIESGQYEDASAVIDQGLELVVQKVKAERLRAALQLGIDQIDRGEWIEFTPEWAEAQFRSALERAAAGETPNGPDVWP